SVARAVGWVVTESGTNRSGALPLRVSRSTSEVSCAAPAVCQRGSSAGAAWIAEAPVERPITIPTMTVSTRRIASSDATRGRGGAGADRVSGDGDGARVGRDGQRPCRARCCDLLRGAIRGLSLDHIAVTAVLMLVATST